MISLSSGVFRCMEAVVQLAMPVQQNHVNIFLIFSLELWGCSALPEKAAGFMELRAGGIF